MKTLLKFCGFASMAMLISFGSRPQKSSGDALQTFLTEMTDARMMDIAESKAAMDRATTQPILDYAKLMVKDQEYLLNELKEFAKQKNVDLPQYISDAKGKALRKLQQKKGKTFDRKFLHMICIDHKRDVGKFTEAVKSPDAALAAFAKKHLPMIESHLAAVEKLKENN